MRRRHAFWKMADWSVRVIAGVAVLLTLRFLLFPLSITSLTHSNSKRETVQHQQEKLVADASAKQPILPRPSRSEDKYDISLTTDEPESRDSLVIATEDCRTRVMSSLEELEKKLGCMHCPEPYRINPKLSVCRKYFAEGRMKRDMYKNVLGTVITSDPYNVTYVTQLTISRFDRLELVAKYWQGSISASIYLERKDVWSTFLSRVCASPHLNQRSNIIYSLMFIKGTFYPTNYLRNMALEATETPYVLLIDVDLMPKPGLDNELYHKIQDGHFSQNKTAWIVPAFETAESVNVSTYDMPHSKDDLAQLYHKKAVQMFHLNGWRIAYNWTLYDKWVRTNTSYEVQYQRDFEPYILIKKDETPKYNERFLSRYRNKVSHLETLYYMGYRFVVLHDAYVIHLPHSDWAKLVLSAKEYYNCAYQVYKDFKMEMKKKYSKRYSEFWKQYPKVWS